MEDVKYYCICDNYEIFDRLWKAIREKHFLAGESFRSIVNSKERLPAYIFLSKINGEFCFDASNAIPDDFRKDFLTPVENFIVNVSMMLPEKESIVLRPAHYGGANNPFEVIKVIDAWGLCFKLGNAAKYIARAGLKDPNKEIEDLEKAITYIEMKVDELKKAKK